MKTMNGLIKEPKISIIITYRNLGKYLPDCILSILNQQYQNFEIIIVNDASNEKNAEIFNNIKNEKVQKITLEKNVGQLCAFLEGLKKAKGEFVCMVDADDILLPHYLKTLLYVHLNYKCALVSSCGGEINSKNEVTFLNETKKAKVKFDEVENFLSCNNDFEISPVKAPFGLWSWSPSSSAMFRKSSLDILKYYPDLEFWKTGADKVVFSFLHLIGGSINIDTTCYLHRHHSRNVSQTTLLNGNKRYLNEEYTKRLIKWNKKIRLDAFKMFRQNKDELIQTYNKLNYYNMFFRIIFCINLNVIEKIIKTLFHKILP